jgi:hypothetical protein
VKGWGHPLHYGWEQNFIPTKFRGIDFERSVIPRKKVLIPRHSELHGRDCFFREMLRNKIPKVYFHFCFTERTSALFYHSESLFLFLFLGTEFGAFSHPQNGFEMEFREFTSIFFYIKEFRVFFSSGDWFGTEFRELSVLRNSRNSRRNKPFVSSILPPAELFFWSEIPNPIFHPGLPWVEHNRPVESTVKA